MDQVRTKRKLAKIKQDTSNISTEERLRVIANIIVDKILEDHQLRKLQFRNNTHG